MAQEIAILAVIALIYGVIATACMMWPERLHAYALRRSDLARGRYRLGTWLAGSPNYEYYVQIVGAISASAALAITLFLLEGVRPGS